MTPNYIQHVLQICIQWPSNDKLILDDKLSNHWDCEIQNARFLPLLKQEHPIKRAITSLILFPYISLSSIWLSLPHRLGGGAVLSDQGVGGPEGGPDPTSLHPVGVASQACPPTAMLGYPLLRILELTDNSDSCPTKSSVFIRAACELVRTLCINLPDFSEQEVRKKFATV